IGEAQPTNRTLGWGIDVDDWDGGTVSGNVFAHYGGTPLSNIYALTCSGHTNDVSFAKNVIYNLDSDVFAVRFDGEPKSQLSFSENALQLDGTPMRFIDVKSTSAASFSQNTYSADSTTDRFRIDGTELDFAAWQTQVGETGSAVSKLAYDDPSRTIESYMASLGETATLEAFVAAAKQQSKRNWQPAYTAAAVNAYVRAGFRVP
ncbi:MAG: hypothetical protein KDA71_19635, partial [Planctomycetales bacterium]|nr:hypothetical protein [Planctomycetales bacterium]